MNKQINELDISKIGDERHMRPNFNIMLSRATDENDRIEQFQKIKSMVEKQGWKIVGKRPGNYEGETLIVAGPKSRKELGETIDSDPGCRGEVQRIETALSSAQMKMMQASKQAADEKETIMDDQIKHIANIITEDPNVIKESRSGWSYHIPLAYDGLDLGFGKFDIEYVVGADWNKEERQTLEYPGSPAHWEWGVIDIEEVDAYNIENFEGVEGIAHPPGLRSQAVGSGGSTATASISLGHNESPASSPEDHFDDTEDEYHGDPVMIMGYQLTPDTKQKFIDALEEKLTDSEMQEELSEWAHGNLE